MLSAQGPDGLSGPCYASVPPNLPVFPQWTNSGTTACFNACVPAPQEPLRISAAPPNQITCGKYISPVVISDSTGAAILGGDMHMDYTRTWEEFNPGPGGGQFQVYRFAVKVDLMLQGGAGSACSIPSCLPATGKAFYYGYMDYAFQAGVLSPATVLMLFHNCDRFIHNPGLSSAPGVFHPATNYAMVWPSTSANPFVASTSPASVGPMAGEATRLRSPLGSAACIAEDRLSMGNMNLIGSGCACPLSPFPLQVTARKINGKGFCPDTLGNPGLYASLSLTPTFPWFHLVGSSIGSWTTAASYPGPERVWADEGLFFVRDAVSDVLTGQRKFGETYYGGSTEGGFTVVPSAVNPTITPRMTDLASNVSLPLPGPIALPLFGATSLTRSLIYYNW
jgi:hypothetical protein